MREILIKKAGSALVVATGMILLLIFIVAMNYPQQKNAYTYLALGDSYTIGEKVKTSDNFPNQAVAILRERKLDFKPPAIVAKTGWTTDELEDGIKKSKLQPHYDFVTLLIGVNDQYRGRKVMDYIPQFEKLLQKAIRYAHHKPDHLIILSIPDWGVTPFAEGNDRTEIAAKIDEYNAANKLIAEKYKVHYIDITPSTRKAASEKDLLAEDGLHPSGKEYATWANKIATIIKSEL